MTETPSTGRIAAYIQKQNQTKVMVRRGLIGGLGAAVVGGAVWGLWPDRDAELRKWNPNFTELCVGTGTNHDFRGATGQARLTEIWTLMTNASPLGRNLTQEQRADNRIVCVGPNPSAAANEPVQYWTLTGVTIINASTPTPAVVNYYLRPEIRAFWEAATDPTNRYVTSHALLWSRMTRVMPILADIDAQMSMFNGHQQKEQRLAAHINGWLPSRPTYEPAVRAYQAALPQGVNAARREALLVLLASPDIVNAGDRQFLSGFADAVNRSEEHKSFVIQDTPPYEQNRIAEMIRNGGGRIDGRPVTFTRDRDGRQQEAQRVNYIEYQYPSRDIHSRTISPALLVETSRFISGQPFLTEAQAQGIINTPAFAQPLSDEAQQLFRRAVDRANRYANNYNGESATVGLDRNYASRRLGPTR